MGRPTKFNKAMADEIVTRIEEGESLREICRYDPKMPSRSTVNRWQDDNQAFQDRVTRARARGAFEGIDRAREIALTPKKLTKTVTKETDDGIETTVTVSDSVERDRLSVDQLWREAEAHAPKVFGKKQQVELSGGLVNFNVDATGDADLVMMMMDLQATGRFKPPGGAMLDEGEDGGIADDDFSDLASEDDFSDIA